MYLVWYILLNIAIFSIFVFPVLYYSVLLNFKNHYRNIYFVNNNQNLINKVSFISFKDLYSEYNYFNSIEKITLVKYLINVKLNLKSLNLYNINYNPYLNYLTLINPININNSIKFNLNYYNNNLNFKKNYYASKFTIKLLSYSNYSLNIKLLVNYSLNINERFYNLINSSWVIKYSPSNFIKYIDFQNINKYSILYLRKNKVFNKGRYSRNRQYYRTGVYWCLYVNIIAVVGIYFWFYRFTMNFGYLWWLLYLFIVSFIVPKSIKFRLYNVNVLLNTYVSNFIWLYIILNNFFTKLVNLVKSLLKFSTNLNLGFLYLNKSYLFITMNIIYLNFFLYFLFV